MDGLSGGKCRLTIPISSGIELVIMIIANQLEFRPNIPKTVTPLPVHSTDKVLLGKLKPSIPNF